MSAFHKSIAAALNSAIVAINAAIPKKWNLKVLCIFVSYTDYKLNKDYALRLHALSTPQMLPVGILRLTPSTALL